MYGQMTAGQLDLHRHPGDPAGHLPDVRRRGREALRRRTSPAGSVLTAGLGGMGGAQPLAAAMLDAAIALRRGRPRADRAPARDRYLDEATDSLDEALARVRSRGADGRGALGRAARQRRRRRPRAGPPRRAVRPRHRPDGRPRPAERVRARRASTSRRPPRCASPIRTSTCGAPARRSPPRARDARVPARREPRLRLRQQPARRGAGGRRRGRVRLPGLRARLHPAALLPRQRAVPLGGPLRRPGGHRGDRRRRCGALFPDDAILQRWLELAPERVAFQGLPARICWLGYGDRAPAGLAINELVRSGRVRRRS